jgi:hypothetical protein
MKHLSVRIFLLVATGLIGCALSSEHAQAAPVSTCVDFSTFPDNTVLGPTLQAGFHFQQLGVPAMFANQTAGRVGLQFPNAGLEVTLPPTRRVKMVIGTFGGPVTLEVRNGANLLSSQVINTSNTYRPLVVTKPVPFTKLVFRGGNNEAIVVRICADLNCN